MEPEDGHSPVDGEQRRHAAQLGRRYLEGTVTRETLLEELGGSGDPLIKALVEAVVHEPQRGFAGISEKRWRRKFREPVFLLLSELRKGESGVVPTRRVYPVVTGWTLAGWTLFIVFAGACALEDALELQDALRKSEPLLSWTVLFASLETAVTTFATWMGVLVLRRSISLFRTRNNPYGSQGRPAG